MKFIYFIILISTFILTKSHGQVPGPQKIDITTLAFQKYYQGFQGGLNGDYKTALNNLTFCQKVIPEHTYANLFLLLIQNLQDGTLPEKLVRQLFQIHEDERDFLNEERINSLNSLISHSILIPGSNISDREKY